MEDTAQLPKTQEQTEEERIKRQYDDEWREIRKANARHLVVKEEIIKAYKILEDLRLDYVNDTMFRDYITIAKKNLEGALLDFLMDDAYWLEKKETHRKRTPKEYDEWLKQTNVITTKRK